MSLINRFGEKPPYGVAGWSADGQAVILYHRYDVWRQPLYGFELVTCATIRPPIG